MFPYEEYLHKLWPICRSITGNGVRKSLDILSELLPLRQIEYPSGLECFDWTIPNEWNIKNAWVKDSSGNKVIDFNENNLHVVSYSSPVHKKVTLNELKGHLHSLSQMPTAIPYRTSYYKPDWGFCIAHNKFQQLKDEEYEVYIDSTLEPGFMTLGEAYLPGESKQEIFLSSYLCHPSMANNELSGPLVLASIYQKLNALPKRKYSYRFLFGPETIGAIVYLSDNFKRMKENTVSGLHIAMLGNDNSFHLSKSRSGVASVDLVAQNILKAENSHNTIIDWTPIGGGDQRQYCSVGIDLPIAYLTRAWQGNFPEYHTSLDNIDSISIEKLEQTADSVFNMMQAIEINATYINTKPFCEPQLGKYGLYNFSGGEKISDFVLKIKYILGYCDGKTDLLTIASSMNTSIIELQPIIEILISHGLIKLVKEKVKTI
ncbi:MAG: DUF4910 domain-containing protein [Colwellia sp.]|nr:DUF4910 domain-containing protein [Colwellia sp.]NQZ80657.1 DUF4910 domain-containing protein [Colwellia sp.]